MTFAIHKCNVPELLLETDPLLELCEQYRQSFERRATGAWAGFSIYGRDAVYTYKAASRRSSRPAKKLTRENIAAADAAVRRKPAHHPRCDRDVTRVAPPDRYVDRGLHRRGDRDDRTGRPSGPSLPTPTPPARRPESTNRTEPPPHDDRERALMNLTDLSQYFFSGLTIGCIYALVALGFVIIANVTQVYNFAQGEYVMIGAMVVAGGTNRGWSMAVLVPLASVAVGAVAFAQERLDRRPGAPAGEPAHRGRRHARCGRGAARARADGVGRGPAACPAVRQRHVRPVRRPSLAPVVDRVGGDGAEPRRRRAALPPHGGRAGRCGRARSTRPRCGCSVSARVRSPPGRSCSAVCWRASSAPSPCRSRWCAGTPGSPSDSSRSSPPRSAASRARRAPSSPGWRSV